MNQHSWGTLDSWIEKTRSERAPMPEPVPGYVALYGDDFARSPLGEKAITITHMEGSRPLTELIGVHLKALWADPDFWEMISQGCAPYMAAYYVQEHYGIKLPEYPPEFWQHLVDAQEKREDLFVILSGQEWRWVGVPPTTKARTTPRMERFKRPYMARDLIRSNQFRALLDRYVTEPNTELAGLMAKQGFDEGTLRTISEIGRELTEDAEWCLAHPGQMPPTTPRLAAGRPIVPERAELIEALVELARTNPDESAGEIARLFKPGQTDDTLRKAAQTAKRLAGFRHGATVRMHKAKGST